MKASFAAYRVHLSIGLLSAALIAFQLALMQVLSIVQWHHFAYMVISVALLGFGAAGTFLALLRERLLARSATLLPALMLATGLVMAVLVDAVQLPAVRFDSYLLFADYSHWGRLLVTYLLFFLPFFLGALAIGMVFVREAAAIGRIYFANLLGSGAGGLIALGLAWLLVPARIPALVAALPVLAALVILPRAGRVPLALLALLTAGITAWKVAQPPDLAPSQYKDLSKTLLLPEAKITMERSSPYGLVQTLSSPVLRYAPGLSLVAGQAADVRLAAFVNGDWYGALMNYRPADTAMVLDYTTMALPYAMRPRERVLVLRAGTGTDVAHALSEGAARITAVEPNAPVLSLLLGGLAAASDSLLYAQGVSVKGMEPRTFLLMDTAHYDLVVLPMVGTFGGSSGLYALQEQFILTREAFGEMWHRLREGGAVAISSWMDYPFRNPLKVQATLLDVLRDLGVRDPALHLAAVRSWGTITFVLTRSPLSTEEVAAVRAFCDRVQFDPVLLPGLQGEERTFYNELGDPRFFTYVDGLFSPKREQIYEDYDFNIRPATDNKPYFSQYIRWGSLQRLAGFFGNRSLPFFEVGYVLVVVTLVQVILLSFILIVLPLFRLGWRGGGKGRTLLYFSGIGLGYMFVEMILIQRFTLYFGNPVYAASAAIIVLLVASGAGSYLSERFAEGRGRLPLVLGAIIGLLLVYSFILTPLLRATIHLPAVIKGVVAILLIAPPAFLMGVPFPAGIAQVSKRGPEVIPWAWGVNGCVSVVSTAGATITAVELGATWVLVLAAAAYGLTLLAQLGRGREA